MSRYRGRAVLSLLVGVAILLLGAIEGWWQRFDYSSDTVSYLDIARAIQEGHWKLALNPLWSLGYPLLFANFRRFFSDSPQAEWLAIHALNIVILAATWITFLFFLRSIDEKPKGSFFVAASAVFIASQLSIDSTWLISPDMLVCCLVFAALALMGRLVAVSSIGGAALLGLVLGAGYIAKSAFLAFAVIFLATFAFALWREKKKLTMAAVALFTLTCCAVPYAAGLSWSFGRPTFGEAGNINYAWHVNKLQLFFHWQGGPDGYGKPIHPSQVALTNPPVYLFDRPFAVSYPPFFNPPYFYEGYRHFFSVKYELRAVFVNIRYLVMMLIHQPVAWLLLVYLAIQLIGPGRRLFLAVLKPHWAAIAISLCGIALFLPVHLEGRYIASFVTVLGTVLCYVSFSNAQLRPHISRPLFASLLVVAALLSVWINERDTFDNIRANRAYNKSDSWKTGEWMIRSGLHEGDKVAVIAPVAAASVAGWAHIAHVHIIGEMGNDIYASIDKNRMLYWGATPEAKRRVLDCFERAGATLAVAIDGPANVGDDAGWERIPGTNSWVYRLRALT